VQVRFDPFSTWDTVQIHSLTGEYLGAGTLYDRQIVAPVAPEQASSKPRHSYTDLLIRQHKQTLAEQTGGIDYRKVVERQPWPFFEFAKTVAQLLGRKAGLTALSPGELEMLKKTYNRSLTINRQMVKEAFEKALAPTVAHIVAELNQLILKGDQ
jgi:hypothetical protein